MSSTDGLPMPRRLGAILAIALGITMAVLDGMIANVALPTIADDLGTSPANSIWVVNAYQLTITMTLLSLSSLGDLWSYRKVYLIGLGLFSLTSGLCALSDSLATLTGARVLQGLGAAALMSVNGALLRLIYPKRMLGRGIGINTLVVAVSTAAGPTVAAGILSVANWPWLFAVNLPIGLAALVMGFRFLPHNDGAKEQRFDKASALLNALTFGLFFAAFSGFAQGQPLWLTALELAATLVAGHFFVRRQLHQAYPLLPVDLLRIPIFSLSICTSICSFWAQMLAMVSIPFYFQKTLGLSEIETGLLMTPWPLATMVMAPIAGRLVERFHGGMLGAIGLGVFALGLLLLALLPAAPSHLEIVLRMLVCGAGFGLFQSPNNHTILSSAPRQRSGGASGMLSTARLIGQTSGAAMVALLFNLFSNNGTHAALIGAALFAAVAALVSALRLTQPRVQ